MARPRRVSTPSGAKVLNGPPAAFEDIDPTLVVLDVATRLFWVYAPLPYDTKPVAFRKFGPLNRFDHHRGDPKAPEIDKERGILYAAPELVCCVGEYFGDAGSITRSRHHLTRLIVSDALTVLDLRGTAATRAGTIPAIGGVGERSVTQDWARWWYEHPALLGFEGLVYASAQTGRDAVALWERAKGKLAEDAGWALDDASLDDDLDLVADELRLPLL